MPYRISRQAYAETYGPTTGDRVRLADTDLILEVEKDYTDSPLTPPPIIRTSFLFMFYVLSN